MYQMLPTAQKRITFAIIACMAIIAGVVFVKLNAQNRTNQVTVVNGEAVIVTDAPKRTAIAIADSNQDGVPDWQESLQETAPIKVTATSSNFIAPDTLTGQFSLDFFEQMVRSKNYGDFGQSSEEMVENFSNSLVAETADTFITRDQIATTNDNSSEALTIYGEQMARIIVSQPATPGGNEASILERALRDQNEAELKLLDAKAQVYIDILSLSLSITVPSSLATEHLVLLNAYKAILNDITAMRKAFSDPMLTLLRVKRYQDDATGLYVALTNLYTKLIAEGATWPSNSVVYQLISTNP